VRCLEHRQLANVTRIVLDDRSRMQVLGKQLEAIEEASVSARSVFQVGTPFSS
jgi:hypothetical protein